MSMTRDANAAEDVAQEAFVTAWHKLPGLREPARFGSWLVGIVRNQARSRRRHQSRHCPDAAAAADAELAQFESLAPTPLERFLDHEADDAVRRAVSALPADQRTVVERYYLRRESTRQIADALGLTEIAVRKRLSRGRTSLRTRLERAVAAAFVAGVLESIASPAVAAAAGTASTGAAPATKTATAAMWTIGAAALTAAAVIVVVALSLPSGAARAAGDGAAHSTGAIGTAAHDAVGAAETRARAPRGYVEMGSVATGPPHGATAAGHRTMTAGLGNSHSGTADNGQSGIAGNSGAGTESAFGELTHGPGVIWRGDRADAPATRPLMLPPAIQPPPPWLRTDFDPPPPTSGAPASNGLTAPKSPALDALSAADVAGF